MAFAGGTNAKVHVDVASYAGHDDEETLYDAQAMMPT